MDNFVTDETPHTVKFEINPKLDLEALQREFYERGRVRVRNFLNCEAADALYHYLDKEARWRTFVVANEALLGTPPGSGPVTSEEDKEILKIARAGAKNGFAAAYDATRLFPEDVHEGTDPGEHPSDTVLASCDEFLASEAFLTSVRKIVGRSEIKRAASQAIRLRAGHFVTFHSSTWSIDKTKKRRAAFFLNLTPEWLPERGGLTEFRQRDGDVIEAYMPVFNTLDVVAFPQGWWVSTVVADDPIYTLQGRLYLE